MKKRTGEQPYPAIQDQVKTQVLPQSSYRATPASQPTQLLDQAQAGKYQAPCEVTKTLPLQTGIAAGFLISSPNQPQQLQEKAQDNQSRARRMRQTRPTTWAMIQHIFAFTTLGLLFIASVFFFIMTPVGQELDETSFVEFSYQFLNFQTQTRNLLDMIPALAGVLALIGLLFVLVWKHRFIPALVGISIAGAANLSTQIFKNYLISKPDYGIQEATLNSAPSGHTTFAAAAGAALFLASPKKLRPVIALLGSGFALAAGFSTIINGWHRPVDVISALLLTSLWTIIGLTILRFLRSEELDMSNTRNSGMILVPLLSIAGFFLGFCAIALYVVTYFDPIPGGALMAATCAILAFSCFTTSTQIALLRSQNKVRSAYTKVWTY